MNNRINEQFSIFCGKIVMNEVYELMPQLVVVIGADVSDLNLSDLGAVIKQVSRDDIEDNEPLLSKMIDVVATGIFYGDKVLVICDKHLVEYVRNGVLKRFGYSKNDLTNMVMNGKAAKA